MKKFLVSAALCGALLGVGGLVVYAATGRMAERQAARENSKQVARIPNVKVSVLAPRLVEDRLTLVGTLEPWESVTISAEVGGKIEWKGVEQGDVVEKDKELFRIDTETIQTRLEQSRARARLASQEFDRVQRLTDRGVGPQRDQDSAVANRDVLDADVRSMEIQLRKSHVKAPMDGKIAQVFAEQDEFTDLGKPLVQIVQLHKVKLRIGIPERDVPYFKVGDTVTVSLDAIADRQFTGTIHLIAPVADISTHTFSTEIALDNTDDVLKPGMIARANLVRKSYPDTLAVPLFSTALIDDKRFAFVEKDGKAELREIEIGVIQGSEVQVTKGLAPGDRLIVAGQREARPGEPVNVTEIVP
ncbi:MAG TPA: efflux RND transporter periplasmic adaptor subunit [Candidatus Hydrogenedentes bacterium]|nr:efflux RND transporter periplasmic adaptor subunit [Candidatus Hydrogenedentota bacterium]HRK36698.1 efflux RND transporter periplasmic adaptor subunit [Candidatus Hydrogenedentota bacterium]